MAELHLVFRHRGVRFALEAAPVRQITWLPELSPLADASAKVIGGFNLHGHVVPVVDPALLFGGARSAPRASDAVIVLDVEGERFGLLAEEMLDATTLAAAEIEAVQDHHELLGGGAHLLRGVAMRDEVLAMVLDLRALLAGARHPPADDGASPPPESARTAPAATERDVAECELLRERARVLARAPGDRDAAREQYALVGIDGETFGIPLRAVREFVHLRSVWPVPCCPPHILGSMNVRGDILTLVDLRPVLGLPGHGALAEVVVVRAGALVAGVAVGEVLDVAEAEGLAPLPADEHELPFCRGTARSGERVFSIIDIEAMLGSRALHAGGPRADRAQA